MWSEAEERGRIQAGSDSPVEESQGHWTRDAQIVMVLLDDTRLKQGIAISENCLNTKLQNKV